MMKGATPLADDPTVVQRILDHIDNRTTDLAGSTWREPLENYRSAARFDAELSHVIRRHPIGFCPSGALPDVGSFLARDAGGIPVIAVRGRDGVVRAFLNACSHRGAQVVCGAGSAKALVCPYHGWTYGLDGELKAVPHDDGFPGLDKRANGLVASTRPSAAASCSSRKRRRLPPWPRSWISCRPHPREVPRRQQERDRRRRELEGRRRGIPRGLSHPCDAPEDVLPGPVRQPERRRGVRPEQPRRLPVPERREAARRRTRPSGPPTAGSRTCTTCSRTRSSRPSRDGSSWSCSSHSPSRRRGS